MHERAVSAGDHSFVAPMDGRYTYCFSNEHWSANTKEVSFNVHGIVYVPESEAPQDPLEKEGTACHNPSMRPGAHKTVVRQLSELVAQVKDEQGYIIIRERTHRNTAESTNARVKWWSIFQLLVLLGEGIFQVWWLKRFFEVSIAGRAPACRYSPMSAGQACSVTEDAILAIVDQHENPFKAYLLSSHSPPILA